MKWPPKAKPQQRIAAAIFNLGDHVCWLIFKFGITTVPTLYTTRLLASRALGSVCCKSLLPVWQSCLREESQVQKNRRMGGAISEEELARICEKIDQLNTLSLAWLCGLGPRMIALDSCYACWWHKRLDVEQPFTFRVQDKQGLGCNAYMCLIAPQRRIRRHCT